MSKRKSSNLTDTPSSEGQQVLQLELSLAPKSASILRFSEKTRSQTSKYDDATRRLLEFAARLPQS